jgi:hypothetical protein
MEILLIASKDIQTRIKHRKISQKWINMRDSFRGQKQDL